MISARIPWEDPKSHNSQMPLQNWTMGSFYRSVKEDKEGNAESEVVVHRLCPVSLWHLQRTASSSSCPTARAKPASVQVPCGKGLVFLL